MHKSQHFLGEVNHPRGQLQQRVGRELVDALAPFLAVRLSHLRNHRPGRWAGKSLRLLVPLAWKCIPSLPRLERNASVIHCSCLEEQSFGLLNLNLKKGSCTSLVTFSLFVSIPAVTGQFFMGCLSSRQHVGESRFFPVAEHIVINALLPFHLLLEGACKINGIW